MNLTFTVYHTCHLEGSLDTIFEKSPYKCEPNTKQWLGEGYYFWTDSDFFAHMWGRRREKYPKGYAITEYLVVIPDESFLDLVGNVKDQLFFKKQIQMYAKKMELELKSKEDAKKIPISKVIAHLRTCLPNDKSAFKYDAIKAVDYSSSQTNFYRFVKDCMECMPIPSRQQLFLKELSFLKNKRLFYAAQWDISSKKYKRVNLNKVYTFKY